MSSEHKWRGPRDVKSMIEILRSDAIPFEVLRKRGISTHGAWITFNSMFKESWGKKEPTLGKAKYKRELVEAKLRHIQQTP